jgi:hypothetical protein
MSATGICKPGSQSPSHSPEKGAEQHSDENARDVEQGSISSKQYCSLRDGRKKVNDPSKNDNNHGWQRWLHWIFFPGFGGWWIRGAAVLVVLLALSGTTLRTAHIGNVPCSDSSSGLQYHGVAYCSHTLLHGLSVISGSNFARQTGLILMTTRPLWLISDTR